MTQLQVMDTAIDIMPLLGQLEGLTKMGAMLVKSGMLPKSITTPEAAVAIMIQARELGIGMMEAFRSINVIQSKPTIAPQLMIALAERSGALQDYRIEDDGVKASCTVTRRGRSPYTATFSMEDARNLKLADKENWKNQPRVMRQWRAVSAAFRVVFADVLAGIYIPEEMGATTNTDGEMIALPPVAERPAPPNGQPALALPPVSDADIDRLLNGDVAPRDTDAMTAEESAASAATIQKAIDLLVSSLKPGVGAKAVAEIFSDHGVTGYDPQDAVSGTLLQRPDLLPNKTTTKAILAAIKSRIPS